MTITRRALLLGSAALPVAAKAELVRLTSVADVFFFVKTARRLDATAWDGACYYHTIKVDRAELARMYARDGEELYGLSDWLPDEP